MKYRALGNTGLKVSEIGVGGFGLGGGYELDKKFGADAFQVATRAVKTAFDKGINLFDTCPFSYNIVQPCEELIGKALSSVRDQVIFASKIEKWKDLTNPVRQCVETSLRQFGTDYLDLVQIRDPNPRKLEQYQVFEEMEALQKEGKIRFASVTLGDSKIMEEANYSFDKQFATLQLAYNLVFRDAEEWIFDKAGRTNTGIIVRGPLCKGFLAERDVVDANRRWFTGEENAALAEIRDGLSFLSIPSRNLQQAAIQFVLRQQAVSTTIISFETADDVVEAVAALDAPKVSAEEWEKAREVIQDSPAIDY